MSLWSGVLSLRTRPFGFNKSMQLLDLQQNTALEDGANGA
jgi:hypothetical protein